MKRLQRLANDTILEITEQVTVKRRLSEKSLLRQKENLETSIADFIAKLAEVNASLAEIYEENRTL